MKKNYVIFFRLFFIIKILLLSIFFSNKTVNSSPQHNLEFNELPPIKFDNLEVEKEHLENDYKKKLEENNILKQQIDKKIRYIKVLLTSGIIMFSIIVYICIKTFFKCKKNENKGNQIGIKKNIHKKEKIEQLNGINSNIVPSFNSSIEKSSYNLLNSDKNISMSNSNNNISSFNIENNSINNISSENEKNYDAPKLADYSNIVINDDNKTLTNNPDLFVPSRMDRILYRPYPNEEIK